MLLLIIILLLLLFVSEIWLAGRHGGIFFRPDRSVKLWKKPLGALRDTVSRVCESRWPFVVLFIVSCFGLWSGAVGQRFVNNAGVRLLQRRVDVERSQSGCLLLFTAGRECKRHSLA